MNNTNFQTLHQMGQAINDVVRQATGRDAVQNIDMDHITVAQNKHYEETSVSGRMVSFTTKTGGLPLEKCIVQIEPVQEGTGDPSPDNVRPISGWTGANVSRTGKNLLNPAKYEWQTRTVNGITYTVLSDGSVRAVGTSTAAGGPGFTSRFQLPAGTYYGNSSTGTGLSVLYRYAMQETDGTTYPTNNPFVSDGTQWFYINLYCNAANLTVDTVLYPQIEPGTTFTGYEPYQGETYDITFPSEAGTVYGGTLDVVSGVLTVDRKMVVIDESVTGWASGYGNANFVPLTRITSDQVKQAASGSIRSALCLTNRFKPIPSSWSVSLERDNVVCFGVSTDDYFVFNSGVQISDVHTWLNENPINFVYELATPVTYQLTPKEIRTLLGTNNIWADTGDIEVTYKDLKELY